MAATSWNQPLHHTPSGMKPQAAEINQVSHSHASPLQKEVRQGEPAPICSAINQCPVLSFLFALGSDQLGWIVLAVMQGCDSFETMEPRRKPVGVPAGILYCIGRNTDGWAVLTGSYCYTGVRLLYICCPLEPLLQQNTQFIQSLLHNTIHQCVNI